MLREAWTLAIETLSWIELKRMSERPALTKAAKQLGIRDSKTIGLAHKLVFETIRRQNLIDFLINSTLAPQSLGDFKLGVQAFLRLYTYETTLADSDFQKAVSIAQMGRSILGWRELEGIEEKLGEIVGIQPDQALKGLSDEERVELLTYHPSWFVKYCFQLFGRKEALRFLEKASEISPTYTRINTLKAGEETLLKKIEGEGVVLEKVPRLKHTYKIVESRESLMQTRSFREGFFYIQDKASCLAAEVADPKAGMTVLDVCAAPGAKTTYLAQLMQNEGAIYSIDYSRRRINVWKREIKRMGVKIATPILADARKPLPIENSADMVILDPPCTSTGAFGKVPSAKWRLTKRSITNMAGFQWEILNTCRNYVGEGGYLIYSTCSITIEENEMLIEKFLKLCPEFRLVDATPKIGVSGLRGLTKCQRLYPHLHECNGFFIAKLLKET